MKLNICHEQTYLAQMGVEDSLGSQSPELVGMGLTTPRKCVPRDLYEEVCI